MSRHIGRVNRTGLALVGLVLTAAGAAALVAARGLLGSGLAPVIPGPLAAYAARPWFWPAVTAVALIIELLALRWLLAQGRPRALRHLDLEHDPARGVTRLSARAATGALENDLTGDVPGERVRASLTGLPADPRLGLTVILPEDADPAAATHGVHGAVARLRYSLETDRLPAVVRLHTVRTHM